MDRSEWPDGSIKREFHNQQRQLDALTVAVDNLEAGYLTLVALPNRVVELRDAVEVYDRTCRAEGREHRLELVEVRKDMAARFDRIDRAHSSIQGVDWKTVLAVVVGVAVPLAIAIITAGAR